MDVANPAQGVTSTSQWWKRVSWATYVTLLPLIAGIIGLIVSTIDGRHWMSHAAGQPGAVLMVVAVAALAIRHSRRLGPLSIVVWVIGVLGAVLAFSGNVIVIDEEGRTSQTYQEAHRDERDQTERWICGHQQGGRGVLAIFVGGIALGGLGYLRKRLPKEWLIATVVSSLLIVFAPGLGWIAASLGLDLSQSEPPTGGVTGP